MTGREIWDAALGELELQMPKAAFNTWVKSTRALTFENDTVIVGVRSGYAKEWLENRLDTTIRSTLAGIVGRSMEVRYVVNENSKNRSHDSDGGITLLNDLNDTDAGAKSEIFSSDHELIKPRFTTSDFASRASTPLNPKFTFATFIVGKSNQLAHAAALAVAEHPGESYNPLFLYGGTGLGKTHLLHALGQLPLAKHKRVRYVSSETFTNDLINSIRNQNTAEFRRYYRELDVLLIDDIQFIAGKESTQEEFFHTFNHLHAANKQIVISSDRHPRAIPTLEERVRSRFEGGMIADIQPPDLELRIAILRTKSETQIIPVPSEVIDFIAHKIQSNIRELEGALIRLTGTARATNMPVTIELATKVLQDLLRHQPITPDQVLTSVAEHYRVSIDDLKGRSRSKDIVVPRQMSMYLLREETGLSLPQIGELLGGRDHTTVMYAHSKVAEEIEQDDNRRRELLAIKGQLYQQQPA